MPMLAACGGGGGGIFYKLYDPEFLAAPNITATGSANSRRTVTQISNGDITSVSNSTAGTDTVSLSFDANAQPSVLSISNGNGKASFTPDQIAVSQAGDFTAAVATNGGASASTFSYGSYIEFGLWQT